MIEMVFRSTGCCLQDLYRRNPCRRLGWAAGDRGQDLESTLRDLRSRLKPGGRLVLGECMKPHLDAPLYLEFFFSFIKSFTEVTLDPRWRPRHGFLTPEAWEAALRHAGYRDLRHTPPPRPLMDQHPSFSVGAIAAWA